VLHACLLSLSVLPSASRSIGRRVVVSGAASAVALSFDARSAVAKGEYKQGQGFDFKLAYGENSIQWVELKVGSGPVPREGQRCTIDYMMTRRGGAKIYSTIDSKIPFSWTLGDGTVIEALEQAVLGGEGVPPLLPGGARRIIVPQDRGYGIKRGDWTTTVRTVGPIPPDFVWADTRGDLVNANARFQDIYLNSNRIDQPDLIIDVKLVEASNIE